MDDNTDKFIDRVLEILPSEGLEELNAMIDEGKTSKESLEDLLKKYNINPATIAKDI
ncbi:hypothetical protein IJI18_02770 [Candidatus Saccharibacteria bacterium]|nr:hypothetical protein [Candidatus Saccharibacteria bacterium]